MFYLLAYPELRLQRMIGQAEQLGANAVVNVRFSTSAVTSGAAELYAYGTAVVAEVVQSSSPPRTMRDVADAIVNMPEGE